MYPKNAHILLIDSDPASQQDLIDPLIKNDYHLSHARDAREGMEQIYQSSPDVILLARKLPDMDGLKLRWAMQTLPRARKTPVIFLTSSESDEVETEAYSRGAVA